MIKGDAERWARGLAEVLHRLGAGFGRVERRRRALAYLRGLRSPAARKNGWQLAEIAGDRTADGVPDFVARAPWDGDAVRADRRGYGVEHLGGAPAVLVPDETGFVKKGDTTCGVPRQYFGPAGRLENCPIGVFVGQARRHGQALIGRARDLPERWAADPVRRAAAGVPQTVRFATKPQLGRLRLARAVAAGIPCAWVAGDSVQGADDRRRRLIESRGRGYVLPVTSAQRRGLKPVEDWREDIPATAWRRLSAGAGANGPRLDDGASLPDRAAVAAGWQKRRLIRRKIKKPAKFACYLTLSAIATSLAEVGPVAGTRWTIEACVAAATGAVGRDEDAGRGSTGWHRPITLAMLAQADRAVRRKTAAAQKTQSKPRRPRSAARPAAAHRARAAPAAVASGLGASARSRARPRLAAVAAAPSAAGSPLPPATTDASS